MTRTETRPSARLISNLLLKTMPAEHVADLLNVLVGAADDECLNDDESRLGERLFEALTEMRPDLVELAHARQ